MGIMFGLVALIVPIVVLVAAVSVLLRVFQRTGPRRELWISGSTPELDARFTRIEEAIDAMAVQVERLAEAERQRVRSGAAAPSALPSSSARPGYAPLPAEPGRRDNPG